MRTKKTRVKPNAYKSTKKQSIKSPSQSSLLYEVMIVIVLLVACLWLLQQLFLDHVHNETKETATASTQEVTTARGDWERYTDEVTNDYYYYNLKTKETVWSTPFEWKDGEVRKGWVRWFDSNSSAYFYEKIETNEMVWDPPVEIFPEDVQKVAAVSLPVVKKEQEKEEKEEKEEQKEQKEKNEKCKIKWCRYQDATTKAYFFENIVTKHTSWVVPNEWIPYSNPNDGDMPEEKDGWIRIRNPNYKKETMVPSFEGKKASMVVSEDPKYYYYNSIKKETSWVVPLAWKKESTDPENKDTGGAAAISLTATATASKTTSLRGSTTTAVAATNTGEIEKGGWIQVKDPTTSHFYYYQKGIEPKKTQWETPLPFVAEEAETKIESDKLLQKGGGGGDSSGGKGCTKYNILEGQDIRGSDLNNVHADTYDLCCDLCTKHAVCESFTFSIDTCWLKSSLGGAQHPINAKYGVTSGVAK